MSRLSAYSFIRRAPLNCSPRVFLRCIWQTRPLSPKLPCSPHSTGLPGRGQLSCTRTLALGGVPPTGEQLRQFRHLTHKSVMLNVVDSRLDHNIYYFDTVLRGKGVIRDTTVCVCTVILRTGMVTFVVVVDVRTHFFVISSPTLSANFTPSFVCVDEFQPVSNMSSSGSRFRLTRACRR